MPWAHVLASWQTLSNIFAIIFNTFKSRRCAGFAGIGARWNFILPKPMT